MTESAEVDRSSITFGDAEELVILIALRTGFDPVHFIGNAVFAALKLVLHDISDEDFRLQTEDVVLFEILPATRETDRVVEVVGERRTAVDVDSNLLHEAIFVGILIFLTFLVALSGREVNGLFVLLHEVGRPVEVVVEEELVILANFGFVCGTQVVAVKVVTHGEAVFVGFFVFIL